MNNDSFVYSFDLKESLFMEDSLGISEIRHISLEPDISIQAFNDYYSIRGVIILSGEYIQEPLNQLTDSLSAVNDFDFKRYIENTIDLGEGIAEFTHRFPVEISVPSYRVKDMNEVAVHIASFDYELPSADKLIIDATVQIQGIQGEATISEATTSERINGDNNEVDGFNEMNAEDVFSFEVINNDDDKRKTQKNDVALNQSRDQSKQTAKVEELEDDQDVVMNHFPTLPALREEEGSEIIEETTEEKLDDEKVDEDDRLLFKKKTQSLEEFFAKDKIAEKSSTEESAITAEAETVMTESQGEGAEVMDESEATDREELSESEEKPQLHFLSDMIQNEEESFTQMRLCIVQKEDTLESIAERYKTTSLHILKKNHLDDDAVSEGQLLYIPIRKNK
ncbi:MAG TPA: stage VI sporulation protein D [Cerasibacillus sp.]|uniref:stage VI sporulation protein D n=1 Tax=Cerasibacillus sp. TaxID=2498711 RepID=UPI002F3F455A